MKPDVIIMSIGKVANCFGRQLCSSLTQFLVYLAAGLDLAFQLLPLATIAIVLSLPVPHSISVVRYLFLNLSLLFSMGK